jgi:mannitol/fructose-specific phosphotransferase system IIA component (Ntr-type)
LPDKAGVRGVAGLPPTSAGPRESHTLKGTTLLTEILDESCVELDMESTTKDAVLESLVDVLVRAEVVTDRLRMLEDLKRREQVMSTGIGGGIAVPHAQSLGANRLALTLGRLTQPIDFESLDERPVRLVFMVVGPEERGGFIRVLARISRLLYSGDLQRNLFRARTPAEALECIRHEEARITG